MRTLVTGIAALTVAVALGSGTAGASTPVTVSLVSCYFNHGGNVTVPAGSEVIARFGWGENNRGRVQDFLNAQTTTADVNGTPVANASGLYGAITKISPKFYATFWLKSVGTLANPGDSLTVHFQVSLSRAVPEGKDP